MNYFDLQLCSDNFLIFFLINHKRYRYVYDVNIFTVSHYRGTESTTLKVNGPVGHHKERSQPRVNVVNDGSTLLPGEYLSIKRSVNRFSLR
jgi:hypothetical protein